MIKVKVKRLRWWHRLDAWEAPTGWVYTWKRPNWVGMKLAPLGSEEIVQVIHLSPDVDTANYGPYKRTLI